MFPKKGSWLNGIVHIGACHPKIFTLLKDEKVTKESRVTRDNTGTGDNSHAALWTAILLMAFAALLLSVKRVK